MASLIPGHFSSIRATSSSATFSFRASYSWGARPLQLSIQSGVKTWTMCVPAGQREESSSDGIDTNRTPSGRSISAQSSRKMWWQSSWDGMMSALTAGERDGGGHLSVCPLEEIEGSKEHARGLGLNGKL